MSTVENPGINVNHDFPTTKAARAISAARRGLAVLPLHSIRDGRCTCGKADCGSPGKHPIADLVPHGVKDATKDPEVVLDWYTQFQDANIGVATGDMSGIAVLDVDADHGGADSLAQLEAQYGPLPATWRVQTGRGVHYYFQHDPAASKNGVRIAGLPGLDWRSTGGYVVAPGSTHASGRTYSWDATSSSSGPAPIPPYLRDLVAEPRRPMTTTAMGDEGKIANGTRNAALASLAGTMRARGMTVEAITAALHAENEKRCDPPLGRGEVEAIARSIARYEPSTNGLALVKATAPEEAPDLDIFVHASITATALLDLELPPIVSHFGDGFIVAGEQTILFGSAGVGKSWIALELAVYISNGAEAFGFPTTKARVGIVSMELDGRFLQKRLRVIRDTTSLALDNIAILCHPMLKRHHVDLARADEAERLRRWVAAEKIECLMLDPLSKVHSADENSNAEMALVLAALADVRQETGCSTLIVHHDRKAPSGGRDRNSQENDNDAMRGASVLNTDAKTTIRVGKTKGGQGVAVRFGKANLGPEPEPFYLDRLASGFYILGESPGAKSAATRDENREAVRLALAQNPDASIRELEKQTGLGRSTVQRHVEAIRQEAKDANMEIG